MPASSSRHPGLDLVRNLAIILVIVQHIVFLGGLDNDGMGFAHKFQARVLEALSQSCVDLFGLLSGYLGVSALGWKWMKFARLWLQVWTTGLLVLGGCTIAVWACPSIFGGRLPASADWLTAAFPLVRDEYWYFTGYLFVFLGAPLVNRYLFAEGRMRLGLAVACVLFLLVCGTTVFPGGTAWLPLDKGYSAAWLICLYVFGAALRRFEHRLAAVPTPTFFLAASVCVALTVVQRLAMAALPALKDAFSDEWTLIPYTSPTVTLAAMALLLGCARLTLSSVAWRGFARLNAALAPCAFGVYLLHVQPFFFAGGFKFRFAFLDCVPDSVFAVAVLGTAIVLYLLLAAFEILRQKLVALCCHHDVG